MSVFVSLLPSCIPTLTTPYPPTIYYYYYYYLQVPLNRPTNSRAPTFRTTNWMLCSEAVQQVMRKKEST